MKQSPQTTHQAARAPSTIRTRLLEHRQHRIRPRLQVESTIQAGPRFNLDEFTAAMNRLESARAFFQQHQ